MMGNLPEFRRFKRHRLAVGSLIVLGVFAFVSMAAPVFAMILGVELDSVDLMNRFAGPSAAHLLGTDELGRDLLVRLLYGGRVSLLVGLTAAMASAVIGTAVGLLAGYYGGRFDAPLFRLTPGVISLPLLPLLSVLAAVDLEKKGFPHAPVQSA